MDFPISISCVRMCCGTTEAELITLIYVTENRMKRQSMMKAAVICHKKHLICWTIIGVLIIGVIAQKVILRVHLDPPQCVCVCVSIVLRQQQSQYCFILNCSMIIRMMNQLEPWPIKNSRIWERLKVWLANAISIWRKRMRRREVRTNKNDIRLSELHTCIL